MTASFLMRMSKHSSTCGRRLETALGTDDDQNTFPADSEYEVLWDNLQESISDGSQIIFIFGFYAKPSLDFSLRFHRLLRTSRASPVCGLWSVVCVCVCVCVCVYACCAVLCVARVGLSYAYIYVYSDGRILGRFHDFSGKRGRALTLRTPYC